ncbi:hypothetical protein GCM10009639_60160 [Kitasatospora putterlickiae]|uniref:Uncharacterized protein n=1 Tax=Kitasatospora putterlickiae TaxID=221725 RepID=A0ABN1YFC2_9ACTN
MLRHRPAENVPPQADPVPDLRPNRARPPLRVPLRVGPEIAGRAEREVGPPDFPRAAVRFPGIPMSSGRF